MSTAANQNSPLWLTQLEKLINSALELDEETLDELNKLSGQVIGFEFINTQLTLYLLPGKRGLKIETTGHEKPDVLIRGTPLNFISLMTSGKRDAATMPADMEIIGNIALAQRFQHIMQNMEIDLEEPLSKWIGDTAAYQVGKFVRDSGRYARQTGKTLAMDISEYLRFEIEMLPDELLVKEFCDDVDTLREDVDRLAQRIDRLKSKLNKDKPDH